MRQGALLVENSVNVVTITNSHFEGNVGINGGALQASSAMIKITIFQEPRFNEWRSCISVKFKTPAHWKREQFQRQFE